MRGPAPAPEIPFGELLQGLELPFSDSPGVVVVDFLKVTYSVWFAEAPLPPRRVSFHRNGRVCQPQ